MEVAHLEVVPLHKYPQYLRSCCELINEEWTRSETARMMSLQASCDELPTSLILINKEKHILGHCKLTPIPSMPNSCFVESVVIKKSMRGKKLGTYLMKGVEQYCKNVLELETIHLSTKGQEEFYAKLGYEVCPPVCIYGSWFPKNSGNTFSSTAISSTSTQSCVIANGLSALPPPPPPMPKLQNNDSSTFKSNKTFMFKYLI